MASILPNLAITRKFKKFLPALAILTFIYFLIWRSKPKSSLIYMPSHENSISVNSTNYDLEINNNINNKNNNDNNRNNNNNSENNDNNGFSLGFFTDNDSKDADFDIKSIKYIPHESIMQTFKSIKIESPNSIDWDKFAYVFYATSPSKLYPVLVNIRELRKFKTKAKIHLIHSFDLNEKLDDKADDIKFHKIVNLLQNKYNVIMAKYDTIKSKYDTDSNYWADSFTKLWAFSLVEYDRIIYLDSDAIIRKNMDELFFLPPTLLAAPLNYINHPELKKPKIIKSVEQLKIEDLPPSPLEYSLSIQDLFKTYIENELHFDKKFYFKLYNSFPTMELAMDSYLNLSLGSYIMVIMPDEKVFKWILKNVDEKKAEEYDMEIINKIWKMSDIVDHNYIKRYLQPNHDLSSFKNSWLKPSTIPILSIIPHAPYGLLSGEFKSTLLEHRAYLTNANDFGYLTQSEPLLSLQRSIKGGINYKDIEDAVESYPEVPYWDWAWRFDFEGKTIEVKELEEDLNIEKMLKFNNKNGNKNDKNINKDSKKEDSEKIALDEEYAVETAELKLTEDEIKEELNINTDKLDKKLGNIKKRAGDNIDNDVRIHYSDENEEEEAIGSGMGVAKFGWDSKQILDDAVYIHWSDWPLGKPWEFEHNAATNLKNRKSDEDSLWLFEKVADESLLKCKLEIKDLVSTLNIPKDSKEGQLLDKERKFAMRMCDESIESWKGIYREYWNNMLDVMKDIYA